MTKILTGKIIKGIGGFYYVDTIEGVIECRARGKFRYDGITPLVGDAAKVSDNYVIDIEPRKNALIRPRVANVDKALITFAAKDPKINFEILDRFLIIAAAAGVKAAICINKADLDKTGVVNQVKQIYEKSGCNILEVSVKNKIGIDEVAAELKGVTTVFAGPSGVGKSSIINLVLPEANLKTGAVSKKISRGKHTTREAVLISLNNGGYVVDTPGFTSLSLEHVEAKSLAGYFNEFLPYLKDCKYSLCSHTKEQDGCAVKHQVGKNIHEKRYSCYERIYKELLELEEARYD